MQQKTITGTSEGLQPSRSREAHQRCSLCAHFEEPGADRVGWCRARFQYRAADIERACDSFSKNGG